MKEMSFMSDNGIKGAFTTVIGSVSDYINAVRSFNDREMERHDPFPKEFLFRGQSDSNYKLSPSLGRYKSGHEDFLFVERNMIETAKFKMPNVFSKDLEPIELLGLLQHYGLPTRLLDLTENALVALFFACEGNPDKDGEVFVFKNSIYDVADYPIINAIADSYRFSRGSFYPLTLFYSDVIQQPYFLEQKRTNEICHKNDDEGGRWIAECCKKPLFVRASIRLTRQQIQRGRYLLFPNEIRTTEYDTIGAFLPRIKPLPKEDESIIGRVIVSADKKGEILNEMKLLGIDRGMLFADSVDIVCEEIKKDYFE